MFIQPCFILRYNVRFRRYLSVDCGSILADYVLRRCYLVLPPLAGVLYKYVNRSARASGIVETVFMQDKLTNDRYCSYIDDILWPPIVLWSSP